MNFKIYIKEKLHLGQIINNSFHPDDDLVFSFFMFFIYLLSAVCKGNKNLCYKKIMGAKGDWDFRISDLVKNPGGTDI